MKYLALTLPGGQSIEPPAGIKGAQGGLDMVTKIVGNSLTILLTIGIVITIIMVVYSGVQWSQSGGNPQKVAAARARLTWGVIGLIVMLLAFFVMALIGYFFKVDLLKIG